MQSNKGFTLVEMVLVIVILGIVAATSGLLLQEGLNSYFTNQDITETSWKARIALETMSRRIREIRSPTDIFSVINTPTLKRINFTDITNNIQTYQATGNTLYLNGNVLIAGVNINNSSFIALDKNGVATAISTDIRYININLVITQNNVSYSIRTTIYPRNLL